MKKTYEEKLKIYNKRIAKFHTNFTREELYEFGTAEGLRTIPQIMRLWLILNVNKFVDMDEMMENYAHFENEKNKTSWSPILQKMKREICHDKKKANKEIEEIINQIAAGRFHFYHLTAMEQLYVFGVDGIDPMRMFTEDIGTVKWSPYTMISALRSLQSWLKKAPKYEYPSEYFMRIQDELV
jgi:hypothetical protein